MNKYGKPCLWILNVKYIQNWLDLIKINSGKIWKVASYLGGILMKDRILMDFPYIEILRENFITAPINLNA